MEKIKIIIVDDHKMFRQTLSSHITLEGIADVIADAGNGLEFLELLDKHLPDLVLMDISMPRMDGIEATKKAIEKCPDLKIIALTSFGEAEYYHKMVDAGAKGFLIKNAGIIELERAIIDVANGDNYFSHELLRDIITSMSKKTTDSEELTNREIEVLQLICTGLTNDEIATKLNLSSDTIKGHRTKILAKTNSKNTASLVMYAFKNKLIKNN
jgi:DNA-binding NarL/FixJ family response regulator